MALVEKRVSRKSDLQQTLERHHPHFEKALYTFGIDFEDKIRILAFYIKHVFECYFRYYLMFFFLSFCVLNNHFQDNVFVAVPINRLKLPHVQWRIKQRIVFIVFCKTKTLSNLWQ